MTIPAFVPASFATEHDLRMKRALLLLSLAACATGAPAATDVRIDFTLNTTDENGDPLVQNRYYHVYRPDGLSKAAPVPMILVMEAVPGSGPAGFFHRKANQAGFVVVSCAIRGNTLGGVWNNDNPHITGMEDMDYTAAVINRVRQPDNCNDAFICSLSKGGHMAYAYACERPGTLKAACSVDEFMGLSSNTPAAPLPVIAFQGTADKNVPYTMALDSVDAWRTIDGLLGATAPADHGSSFRAVVSNGSGSATSTAALLTVNAAPADPRIVTQPTDQTVTAGQPVSFAVTATGTAPLRYQWKKNGMDLVGETSAINPDIAGDWADPDGDEANNLLEYTRGTDPLAADAPL